MTDVMASVYNELNGEFNNMNNLVFFDIDGTLAIRTNVPASAEKALEIIRANGDKVFICTGRNPAYVRKNFSATQMDLSAPTAAWHLWGMKFFMIILFQKNS